MTKLLIKSAALVVAMCSPLAFVHASDSTSGGSSPGSVSPDDEGKVIRGIESIPELDCIIEPSDIVDVGVALPGVVHRFLADRSDTIKKGDVLVQMDDGVELAAARLAKARAGMNTAVELREETAAFGDLTQKRNQELFKKSAISTQEMDQLKTETRIAKLQVQQEKDNKRIAQLQYRRARAVLDQRTVRSPFDGVVMDRFKTAGEYVDDEPLMRVAQIDPLHVEVILPVIHLGKVKTGMKADVSSLFSGVDDYVATVERVDSVADTASGTFGVRLSLANPEHKIPAGLRCHLSFIPEEPVQQVVDNARSSATEPWDQDD